MGARSMADPLPDPPKLSLRQEHYVHKITDPRSPETFLEPSASYRAISPSTIKPQTSWQGAMRMSRNIEVQTAIKGLLGQDKLGNGLKWCMRTAKKTKNTKEVRGSIMDYASLTGQLIQRQEIKHSLEEQKELVRQVVNEHEDG